MVLARSRTRPRRFESRRFASPHPLTAAARRALEAVLADPLNSWRWYALAKAGITEGLARSALWHQHGPNGQAVRDQAFGYREFRDAVEEEMPQPIGAAALVVQQQGGRR